MKRASDLMPWKVTDISLRPYDHFWSFNPSLHFDGKFWRCALRCADYCMRDGETVRSSQALPGESRTKNAMVIFDPASWKPIEIYKMREHDGLRRVPCSSVGYEDIRIFRTDKSGLQGIAASLHLWRGDRGQSQLVEQVLLSLDADYNVMGARPIRGTSWGMTPQKNWVPFDGCTEPRFLYSIADGKLFDERGPASPTTLVVPSSMPARGVATEPSLRARKRACKRAAASSRLREDKERQLSRTDRGSRGVDLSLAQRSHEDLRGGTQLVRVGDVGWLGIGHKMMFVNHKKLYWHVWYLVDSHGKMIAASPPMKLAPNGIEFAAGMGIDDDRVVVSFGVDDMECKIGETRLADVLTVLQEIGS